MLLQLFERILIPMHYSLTRIAVMELGLFNKSSSKRLSVYVKSLLRMVRRVIDYYEQIGRTRNVQL